MALERFVELKVCFWCEKDCKNTCEMGKIMAQSEWKEKAGGRMVEIPKYYLHILGSVSPETDAKWKKVTKKVLWPK